jgi:hypothetical protein
MTEKTTEITKTQIEQWKKQYGGVYQYTSGELKCFLKRPDRKILAFVRETNDTPMKFNEALINNCWLSGDEELRTDDKYFLGLSAKIDEIIEVETGEMLKL